MTAAALDWWQVELEAAAIDHGTMRGYRRHGRLGIPRCAACRAAHAEYIRQYRRVGPQHGRFCRCDACRAAKAERRAAGCAT